MKTYYKTIVIIYALYLTFLYAMMHEEDIKKAKKKIKKNFKNFRLRFEKVNYEVVK